MWLDGFCGATAPYGCAWAQLYALSISRLGAAAPQSHSASSSACGHPFSFSAYNLQNFCEILQDEFMLSYFRDFSGSEVPPTAMFSTNIQKYRGCRISFSRTDLLWTLDELNSNSCCEIIRPPKESLPKSLLWSEGFPKRFRHPKIYIESKRSMTENSRRRRCRGCPH